MKLKAIFVVGPNNSQIKEIDEAYPKIQIIYRVMNRKGKMVKKGSATYHLKRSIAAADELLKYEYEV